MKNDLKHRKSFALGENIFKLLQETAGELGISDSEIIRQSVIEFCEKHSQQAIQNNIDIAVRRYKSAGALPDGSSWKPTKQEIKNFIRENGVSDDCKK